MSEAVWRESEIQGITSVIGENEYLRVEIIPSRGSKLISFVNLETGMEWVFRNNEPWSPLTYGMQWGDGDRSGWDEMFPTILPCPCPDDPWKSASYPDHGEVWALPWQFEITGESVRMWVHGVQVPYIFSKIYSLSGKELTTKYEVHNPTPFAFSYMWCAHFLLAVRSGMKIVVDPRLDSVQYQYSHHNRLTPRPYGRSSFPLAPVGDSHVDLSVIEENLGQNAEKYWFEAELSHGVAGIVDPESGNALTYLFSTEDVPYLAVWANYGAFSKDFTIALEPATGFLDDLYVANLMKKVKKADPYSSNLWDFVISIDPKHQHTAMSTLIPRSEPTETNIAPWLSVSNAAEAIDYYREAFGVTELYRLEDSDGKLAVAQLSVRGADFWIQEDPGSSPESVGRGAVRMILTVEDPDSLFEQALAAGATEVAPISEGYGWRIGRVVDPFGHHWEIGKRLS